MFRQPPPGPPTPHPALSRNANVCTQVDILTWRNKAQRIHVQIRDICSILSGLVVAQDYRRGQELVRDRDFKENEGFFQVGGARQHVFLLVTETDIIYGEGAGQGRLENQLYDNNTGKSRGQTP